MAGRHKWEEVRAKAAARDPHFENHVARERALLVLGERLQELRERRGTRQGALAEDLDVSQANISRIESQEDLRLSTLERYVEALGGHLEVHAVFDDDDVVLVGDKVGG